LRRRQVSSGPLVRRNDFLRQRPQIDIS
jgi:hypothetical protein